MKDRYLLNQNAVGRLLVVLFWIFIFLLITSGCSTFGPTAPNEVYRGYYPDSYLEIQINNRLLADEIGKLPELQDGIQANEVTAIGMLAEIYKQQPKRFDSVFEQMYKTGLPDVRKYCTPLQALFWLAQEGESEAIRNIIDDYSLDDLLYKAWQFDPPTLTNKEISQIIDDLTDPALKNQYIKDSKTSSKKQIQNFFMVDYRLDKRKFSKRSKDILERFKAQKHPHWSDFNTVVERLNSPELVDYYEKRQIDWVDWRTLQTWPVSTQYVFQNGKGDCTGIADFTALCLSRGGYNAYELKLAPRRPVDKHHSICVFYVDGIKYIMDNGSPSKKGIFLSE